MGKLSFLPHPSVAEIEAGLRAWAEQRPDRLQVLQLGRTSQGRPILCARITDHAAPDADKQVVLFTATHAGPEFNSCTGLLRTARWLLGDEGTAPEIRRRVITLICPCCNPDGYAVGESDPGRAWGNQNGGDPCFAAYSWDGIADPEHNPEAVALVRLADEYLPDVHVDVHGVRYAQQAMWDTTGWSWGSSLARPYCRRLVHEMDAAADAAGFFPIFPEDSAGRLRVTEPIPGRQAHFYAAPARVTNAVYTAHRYHALAFHIESGYDESTLVRLRRCLELGLRRWRGEPHPGYPTLQVGGWCSMTIAACGATAAERRRSRVELWGKVGQMAYGCGHPEPARGFMMAFCATTPRGIRRFLAPGGPPSFDGPGPHLETLVSRLREEPRFDANAVAAYVADAPSTHAATLYPPEPPDEGEPPREGMALRLHIPYADARITEVRLDGYPTAHQAWGDPGTTVQVSIPPGQVRDFHVVTCRYETATERRPGFTAEDWHL